VSYMLKRGNATLATLREALDDMGIGPDDFFTIAPAPDGGPTSRETPGPSRKGAPSTSARAGHANLGGKASLRHRLAEAIALAVLEDLGGLTVDEFAHSTGSPHQSVSGRATELRQWGYVEASGLERKTEQGEAAQVLRPTPKLLDELEKEGIRRPTAEEWALTRPT
jgi:hypothetical protein